MKLLIGKCYTFTHYCVPSHSDDELSYIHSDVEEMCLVAKRLGCSHDVAYTDYRVVVVLHAQKIVLDSVDMNTLFSRFLTELFTVHLEYAELGGEGCDFTVRATCTARLWN